MKKTRILFDSQYVARGGVEILMRNLIDYLPKDQYEITVAAVYWDKEDPEEVLPPGIHFIKRYHRRRHYKKGSIRWFLDVAYGRVYDFAVRMGISLLNYDIAIATQEKRTMLRTDQIRAKRKFAWVHTDYSTRLDHTRAFSTPEEERNCMSRFEKVVCVSRTTMDSIITTIGDPGNLCVRYNPIDVPRIRKLSEASCPLTRRNDRPLLISVGRLVAEKNYRMLLEACIRLKDRLPFEMWIIGDGEERSALEEMIAREGLASVRLLGTQSNPFQYVRQADLFVSSSVTEGYGLAVQEALILGVPVVAVRCPGIVESLDSRFGQIVEASSQALSEAILTMLEPTILEGFRQRIAGEFPVRELYIKRLEAICALWEDSPQN